MLLKKTSFENTTNILSWERELVENLLCMPLIAHLRDPACLLQFRNFKPQIKAKETFYIWQREQNWPKVQNWEKDKGCRHVAKPLTSHKSHSTYI
jgi:hypothetical protein